MRSGSGSPSKMRQKQTRELIPCQWRQLKSGTRPSRVFPMGSEVSLRIASDRDRTAQFADIERCSFRGQRSSTWSKSSRSSRLRRATRALASTDGRCPARGGERRCGPPQGSAPLGILVLSLLAVVYTLYFGKEIVLPVVLALVLKLLLAAGDAAPARAASPAQLARR